MLRLALKSVRHNPKRLILTAFAVALGVALVAATLTFTSALSRGFTDLFGDIYSSVDVIVEEAPAEGEEGEFTARDAQGPFSDDDVAAVKQVDGVLYAEGSVAYETGMVLNADGDAPLGMGAPTLVYGWYGIPDIDGSTLVDGAGPSADGDVVVDVDTYAKLELAPGDTVKIATDDGVQELTVTGSIRFGENNELQTANLMYANEATVRELAGGVEGFRDIQVVAEDGADPDAIVDAISPLLPDGTRAITSQDKVAEQIDSLNEALNIVDVFALIFGLVALFVGAYIIVNTFRIIVTQRTREFGLLRAIGAQGSQIRNSILVESVVVGLVGTTAGILTGWGLALAGGALVESFSGNILGTLVLPVKAVLWSYSLGVSVTVIAALLPAIHASRISPMEALREAGTAGKKSLRRRNIVGGALTLLGVAGVLIGLYGSVPRPAWWVGAGAVLIVLGVTLLAAQVIVPLAYGLRGVLSKLWGVNGKLAANNIHREPRRSANTAAALMIGVMLLALVATFTESVKDTFTSQFATNKAELIVMSQATLIPQGAVDVIAETEGVNKVARYGFGEASVDGENFFMGIVDAEEIDGVFELETDRPLTELGQGVFIDASVEALGYEVGDQITVEGPEGSVTLEVTGLYLVEGDQPLIVDWSVGEQLVGEPDIIQALVDFDEGADLEATTDAVNENLKEDFPLVMPQSPEDIEQFFNQALDILLAVISGLLGAALLIAILGVANTLLLSVTERTREIGLLRAVGVTRKAVWGMITLESVVMAVFGTLLGIILGVGLGAALVNALAEYGFERVVVPWVWIAIYTVLSMIAGVIAAIWPAWRASRLDILKAIAADG
ncbi:ABC transporter permease [Demequina sp. TTPB684]|uniref:ABC transporter permease n=1 Tax=unclassified Demequina TaxID=2620311 RepID=UPI001CF2FDFE|nr:MULTISPECIES: ABC transporter permease [unclassified Demequina]MCB2411440.1 ABC transporter permease [Demequina sp. TTPB684]UPU88354.1 ABC transporter permease [Demequina sp. TMPB413]